jgi:hypothetical protein
MVDIAVDGQVRHLILVQFRRINIDMANLAVLGELGHLAGHSIVEPHSQSQQQIGLVDGVVGIDGAVHAEHMQAQEVIGGETAQAVQGQCHRNARPLSEGTQMARRAGSGDAATSVDDGLSALADHGQNLFRVPDAEPDDPACSLASSWADPQSVTTISRICTSLGMSMMIGPGRPVTAM